ncbi:MAG: HAD-IC family P-type ATPase, partial [Bacteroides sp.]|nr:HAD-IC family P-type ATPase [Bacteroides sp.]
GIIDPPRQEVKKAVDDCHHAGIRVIMVTGDHQRTAAAIAEEVGIIKRGNGGGDYPKALTENELKDLDEEEFDEMIEHVSVFARVSPATKLRIAERLQKRGALIAMTGDGVNDAPALKKADVGIAMGKKGTDVAKDAAHIVLSDDNFASIVNAIREGRIVFKNVKSTSYFLLTTNFASTSTLIFSLLLGMPIPLTAAQILWVNIVTDGIMDVAKSTEPGHGDMMKRKPIKKNERILTWDIMPYLFIMAAVMVTLALLTFNHYLPKGLEMARTGAFLVIAMTQVFNVFNMRDIRKSVFKIGLFSNKWINLAFVASIVLQFAVVKIPFLQSAFGFQAINILDFLIITGISTLVLWIGELYKLARRKFFSKGDDD